jgi:hypothetical protein
MTTIFMICPPTLCKGVSGCVVFDDGGSAAENPCGGLEARLNFAWISVQASETKEQDEPRKTRGSGGFRLLYRPRAITVLSMAFRFCAIDRGD